MKLLVCLLVPGVRAVSTAAAQQQLEHVSRRIVAFHQSRGKIAVSWRLLGTDPVAPSGPAATCPLAEPWPRSPQKDTNPDPRVLGH